MAAPPDVPMPPAPVPLDRLQVRPRYCRLLVELLAEEGVAARRVLAGTGLSVADLDQPERRISFDQQRTIYGNALTLTTGPALGLRLGLRQRISDHGIFGYAIQSSADLEQALRVVVSYQATVGPLLDLELEIGREFTIVAMSELAPLGAAALMAREEVLASIARCVLALSDPPARLVEVRLDLPSDATRLYRKELGCPVRRGAPRCEMVIASADLGRRLVLSDEETAAVCERRCSELLERLGSSGGVVESVRRVLVESSGQFPKLAQVGRELGTSDRTLRRRLAEAGTTFQEVVDEVRKGLALDYLQKSNLTVDEIASLLGYTETPNFYRAFKRWTGSVPSAHRGADGSNGLRA